MPLCSALPDLPGHASGSACSGAGAGAGRPAEGSGAACCLLAVRPAICDYASAWLRCRHSRHESNSGLLIRQCHMSQPQITAGTIISRSGIAAAVGRPVTEVPRAQGRTALPWAVQPEKQWAMLRHHAGAGGMACRTALRVAGAASDSCSSAGSARSVASRLVFGCARARSAYEFCWPEAADKGGRS